MVNVQKQIYIRGDIIVNNIKMDIMVIWKTINREL